MNFVVYHTQILDGETIREWMEPTYMYYDGTGYGHPWELIPLGNYTLRTKAGDINGYSSAFQMAVSIGLRGSSNLFLPVILAFISFL